ncbi:hypothetical protein CRD60_05635 [Bifidobacterium aemilianum]|uniref:Leucine-rich repeat domain-containing protein n=1 Tax=Bifidobacterium aemilianum TaxID=2493120 RepID=A0A366K7S6_9BIFI|nr:leucine-rich repeat domain-containing protein [Bifidobacterium aemilianum]RBP97714.1 hypothetical protein CRD60_05635 [Bifidobacterium aemilianum]
MSSWLDPPGFTGFDLDHVNCLEDASGLAAMTNLWKLTLRDCFKLTDLEDASGLPNLPVLDISPSTFRPNWNDGSYVRHGSLYDLSPLAGLEHLTTLRLAGNQNTEIEPVASLTSLQSLDLTANRVSGLTPLSNLEHLTKLILPTNRIRDITPLTGLIEHHLKAPDLSDQCIRQVLMTAVESGQTLTLPMPLVGMPGERYALVAATATTWQWDNLVLGMSVMVRARVMPRPVPSSGNMRNQAFMPTDLPMICPEHLVAGPPSLARFGRV